MSKRTERREAERAARKAAHQELRRQQSQAAQIQETLEPMPPIEIQAAAEPIPELPIPAPTPTISPAQLAANQAIAQLSTGPSTPSGKSISSRNALKHGLTSQSVVLPTEDASEYEQLLSTFIEGLQPATEEELNLVQTIIDSQWRINRCKRLETALLMKGQIELQSLYPDQPPAKRRALIDVEAYLKYEKSLRNLQLQESRLRRLVDKSQAELNRLQMIRKSEERAAARTQSSHAKSAPAARPQPNGFDFATSETHQAPSPAKPNSAAGGAR